MDIPAVCADKVMNAALKHIEIVAKAHEKGTKLRLPSHSSSVLCEKSGLLLWRRAAVVSCLRSVKGSEDLQQAALEEYGPDLHVALRSRRDELLYLRKLTEMLFPFVMPPKATDCRWAETLCALETEPCDRT